MISDDHEYWNNYPFYDGFNPYLITLKLNEAFRQKWTRAAQIGVKTIQQIEPIRTFSIGNELSFCVADLRMERNNQHFFSNTSQQQLLTWINELSTPGVLVIPQPLIAGHGDKADKNLPDWDQYAEIIKAIEQGEHDIVVLTGDVHYGRVSQVLVGGSDNKLTEVITSPLSNLSEINGIATSGPDTAVKKFPLVDLEGVKKTPIKHLAKVTTESKWWDIRYPVKRTHEHFMTAEFYRSEAGIKMKVNAWHARVINKRTGLPTRIKGFNVKPQLLR
jgi:hypothetical protein